MTPVPGKIINPVIPSFELGTLISNLIAMGLIIAAILVILYLVWGGIEWITSGGDKAGLEAAKNRITNAIVGLVIVAATWAIIVLVTTFLGFPFPKIPIPELGTGTVSPSSSPGVYHLECSDSGMCVSVSGAGTAQCGPAGSRCGAH